MKNRILRFASVILIFALAISVWSSKTQVASALASVEIQSVSVDSGGVFAPGADICFHVTVKVNDGQLLESRGDMLRNIDGNLYGHWPHIAVLGTVNAGEPYTFHCYGGMVAPAAEGDYESKWRVWRDGDWVGEEVVISFKVRNGGGGYPVPNPYNNNTLCESTARHEEFEVDQGDGTKKLEHFIVLTIPFGDVQDGPGEVKTIDPKLNFTSIAWLAGPVANWDIHNHTGFSTGPLALLEREWRIVVPTRLVGTWTVGSKMFSGSYRDMWLNHPEKMVNLRCINHVVPTIPDQLLKFLKDWSIVTPTPGTQLRIPIEVPPGTPWIQTSLRQGSKATITLIAPDGTAYSPTSSAVTYTDTSSFAVHTLNLDTPQGGTWQVVIDVISAESDSVFMLDVYGKQYNDPSIDNIPPVTGMHFDGTKGLDGWFVSDVVVTLSAEDNPDGSGVQGIEWSIDNGNTWQGYVSPFVISQEGLSYVLGRSYDNAGNYEQSPIGKFLFIDKTPPVVNVSTDQSEYTRVQPFVVHYSAFDPEPGSGLAALTGLFNDQPVTDGQTVDLFWLSLGQYAVTATGEDYAGWVTTDSETIQLIATISSLQQTVSRLCTEKYITKQGICTSLQQKLESALAAQQRGQKKTAVNILLAFQNELNAQKGKAVQLQAYDLLMMDSNYVITVLGGKR